MTTAPSTQARIIGGRYALGTAMIADGVSTVWQARDQRLGRDVAIREVVMPPGISAAERQRLSARSVSEARIAAKLHHPSVVPICDVVMEGDRAWIVMELVAARSLHEIVRDEGPLPLAVVADIGLRMLGALEAAHAAGVLHRNVKPGNILLGPDGRAVLAGFGVARTSGDSALTSAGLALCSPPYLPPERARGDAASPASDLWSLGATLYTAVEGRPPFDEGDPMPTLAAILRDPPAPTRRAGPLATVLAGLLEKDPQRRWDVDRARAGCRSVLTGGDAATAKSLTPRTGRTERASQAQPRVSGRRGNRRVFAIAGAAVVCLLIAVLLGIAFAKPAQHPAPTAPAAASVPTPTPRPATTPQPVPVPVAAPRPAAPLPTDYVEYVDDRGFSLDVPSAWTKEERPNGDLSFREPAGGRILAVQRVLNAGDSIRAYWEAGDIDQQSEPGYRSLGITAADLGQQPGADWEFTRTLGAGGAAQTQHTIGRGTIRSGRAYVIYLSTPEADFVGSKPILDRVASTFRFSR